jgi:hypothetical protein
MNDAVTIGTEVALDAIRHEITGLLDDRDRMVAALEWYADATEAEFFNDKGKKARIALGGQS